jgi:hypothetical protein
MTVLCDLFMVFSFWVMTSSYSQVVVFSGESAAFIYNVVARKPQCEYVTLTADDRKKYIRCAF